MKILMPDFTIDDSGQLVVKQTTGGEPKNDTPFTDPVGEQGPKGADPGYLAKRAKQQAKKPTVKQPPPDEAGLLGIPGLPPDVQAKVDQIFRTVPDQNQAIQIALAYIRGTAWYAQTYPGIKEGIEKGVISNEADYRAMLNQANQIYQRWQNRAISGDEFAHILINGQTLDTIDKQFAGAAYVQSNQAPIQYAAGNFGGHQFTPDELKAFGEEKAGLDSPLGIRLQTLMDQAQKRLQGVFQGTAATPAGLGLGGGQLASNALNPAASAQDLGA